MSPGALTQHVTRVHYSMMTIYKPNTSIVGMIIGVFVIVVVITVTITVTVTVAVVAVRKMREREREKERTRERRERKKEKEREREREREREKEEREKEKERKRERESGFQAKKIARIIDLLSVIYHTACRLLATAHLIQEGQNNW